MEIIQQLGGIDVNCKYNEKIIEVIGGFDSKLNPIKNNLLVGNKVKTFVKNKITEWSTFKDIYYENGKLDPQYYDKFIQVINNIIILPMHSNTDKDLMYMIKTIYDSQPDQIYTGMKNVLQLLDPFKLTTQTLFMSYKIYIEKLIEIYINVRNLYIDDTKDKKNDLDAMLEKWNEIDIKNKIGTSSTILFFNFPIKTVKLETTIPKIEWNIDKAPQSIKKHIDIFLNALNNFAYTGFCPHDIITRFKMLLSFPADELLELINSINPIKSNEINTIINKINTNIYSTIKKIESVNTKEKIVLKKEHKKLSAKNNISNYEYYIESFISIYKQLTPLLIEEEQKLCDISIEINIIANNITTVTKLLSKIKYII